MSFCESGFPGTHHPDQKLLLESWRDCHAAKWPSSLREVGKRKCCAWIARRRDHAVQCAVRGADEDVDVVFLERVVEATGTRYGVAFF